VLVVGDDGDQVRPGCEVPAVPSFDATSKHLPPAAVS
jgi:hypothetical protein